MKRKRILKRRFERAMLHYGISLVLIALAAGVIGVLCVLHINEKVPVSLVRTADGKVRAYLPPDIKENTARTLRLDFAGHGSLSWRVVAVAREPEHLRLTLEPTDSTRFAAISAGNTLLQATLPRKQVRLIELVFRKTGQTVAQ